MAAGKTAYCKMAAWPLLLAVGLALLDLVSAQPFPGPSGIEYDPSYLEYSGFLTQLFYRCPDGTVANASGSGDLIECKPFTSSDIPVTYEMQTAAPYVAEQIKVVPASPNGRYYTISFVVPSIPAHTSARGAVTWSYNADLSDGFYTSCSHKRYSIYPRTVAYYVSGYIYACAIGATAYSTKVYYAPSFGGQILSFTTFPPPGGVTTLGLVADLGQTLNASSTLDNLAAGSPDLILFAGDLALADNYGASIRDPCVPFNGTNVGEIYYDSYDDVTCGEGGLRWDSWGRLTQKTFSIFPVTFVPGNHELESEAAFQSLVPFIAYTARIPPHITPFQTYQTGKSSIPQAPSYYSINIGQVHVIALSTYDYFQKYSNQYNWIQDDIKTINRSVTPWVVAFMHVPWYNSNSNHYAEGESMRVIFEPFLFGAGTDLVHAGHVFAYERTYPVYKYALNQCGPTHVTVGDGGNDDGVVGPFLNDARTGGPPIYSAYRDYYFGASDVVFTNASYALYTWYRNIDAVRTPDDEFVMVSKHALGTCGV